MVKSEIITEEATPSKSANNTTFTPGVISWFVVAAAIVVLIVGISIKHDQNSADQTKPSQPATTSQPLSVQPVANDAQQNADGSASVQAAGGGISAPTNSYEESGLNSTGTTPDAAQGATYNQQTSGNQTINTVR